MNYKLLIMKALGLSLLISFSVSINAQSKEVIHIWPDKVPGETEAKHPAVQTDNTGGDVIRLTDVTDPILEVYTPEEGLANGRALIVCPGGGYNILAINLEGYEVAEWLNSLGYTAFVLQYRVPDKKEGALMDAQRAMRIVRSKAKQWNIYPDKIGIMGFSAGGSLSARVSTLYNKIVYDPIDEVDQLSCRPDFAALIYPAYLDKGEGRTLTPELKVDEHTPPMYIFATADDPYGNSALVMAGALRDAKVPVELHLLANGGHGYGLRAGKEAGETWPKLMEKWLKVIVNGSPSKLGISKLKW